MDAKEFKQQLLNKLYESYRQSDALLVQNGSKRIVFGEGNPDAHLMFIGEAPGAQEDLEGRPFVGRSGKLLNKLLQLANTERKDVFITNIVKCRPPNNRKPTPTEMDRGRSLLFKQMQIIRPQVVCTLGASALEGLLNRPISITKTRGKLFNLGDFLILPTYHPAFILRNPKELKTLTQDILAACQKAEEPFRAQNQTT